MTPQPSSANLTTPGRAQDGTAGLALVGSGPAVFVYIVWAI